MSESATTPYSSICEILADLWIDYRIEPDFMDFISYNDVGLPLAYFIHSGIVESSPKAELFIRETWNLFLESLGVEDLDWDSLDQIVHWAEDNQ